MAEGQTKAQKEARGVLPTSGMTAFTPGGTQITETPVAPAYDEFFVHDEERSRWNIGDESALAWVRDPRYWERYEMTDRIRQFQNQPTRKGAQVVHDETGEPVKNFDLVLMKYPMIHKEREEAARTQEYENYVNPQDVEDTSYDNVRRSMKARARAMRAENERAAMTGAMSPTSGLDLRQAYARLGTTETEVRKKIEAEEARYRGSSRQQSFDNDDWAKMIDATSPGRNASRGRSVSMGDSGFGRNPNSAVAQAARKGKG